MEHTKDECWKKRKDGKASSVLVDDEKMTLKQLNRLCGAKHDFFPRPKFQRDVYLLKQWKMTPQITEKQCLWGWERELY
jgi:hypothetical protein